MLKKAGLTKDQLDGIELNEAFAAQSLEVIRDSELDPDKVNPLRGAIALGHHLGATGAVRTATLAHRLPTRQQKDRMVTPCIRPGLRAARLIAGICRANARRDTSNDRTTLGQGPAGPLRLTHA